MLGRQNSNSPTLRSDPSKLPREDGIRNLVSCYGIKIAHGGGDFSLASKQLMEYVAAQRLNANGDRAPIEVPDPKVDIAAVNPWMLRMAGEVADGVHIHPLSEPGYCARQVIPNVAEGAGKSRRSPSDIAVIVPVMTIVGDSEEERRNERELVRASMSFYASTPNYAFILDEAGFDGTTARIYEKQKARDFKGMASQITDDHIATFATESTWDGLEDALVDKYEGIATRIVLYNALGDPERFERYGEVAQRISARLTRHHKPAIIRPFGSQVAAGFLIRRPGPQCQHDSVTRKSLFTNALK